MRKCHTCESESALHSRAKKGKRVTASALRSSRLPPPTSCVQAAFCGFHRFTSTVFGFWLLRRSRGELLFRPSFLCDRFLMHLRLSALGEQGLRRFISARFCFPSCEVLEGEPAAPSEDFCALTMLVTDGVYRSPSPRLEAAACRTHRAVGGNDDAA